MKNSKSISIIIIVILLVAVVYLFIQNGKLMARSAAPAAAGEEYAAKDKDVAPPMADDFMKPHLAPALTDAQKAELAAGAAPHAPATLTYDISGGSFFYAPNEISAVAGDTIKLVFNDVGGVHNITFDDPKIVTKTIKTGETDTIEFKAPKKGTYEFYCSVGKGYHRMMGQIGVLIVR